MSQLRISLFGKFCVRREEELLPGFESSKIQEFFCYLLLFRNRPHARETLASNLWGNSTTAQSKKYLRQALWHLQYALENGDVGGDSRILCVEPNWIQLNLKADFWLDVDVFERAFVVVQGKAGQSLDKESIQLLQDAVELYQGELLEGSYQDWCLYERERLQNMYLAMLEKLASYCECNKEYDAGLSYATRILRYDHARECTHRRLMRLQYLLGNRSAALRQYERCVTILDKELGVKPDKRTTALYEQFRKDSFDSSLPAPEKSSPEMEAASLSDVVSRLKQLQKSLLEIQRQVQKEIQTVELVLNRMH